MKSKGIALSLLLVCLFSLFALPVHAQADTPPSSMESQDYYQEQMEISGADELSGELPNEARVIMENMGVADADWESLKNLTPSAVFQQVVSAAQTQSSGPLKAAVGVLAVMLLCALMEGMKLSLGDRPLSGVAGVVSTLCVCTVIVVPIVSCVQSAAQVIQGAAGFMLCYVPVIAGIMIAGGQTVSAASYHLMMVGAGEVISQIATGFLVPMLNVFLALSITASVSPRLNLNSICDAFHKVVKWVLGIVMTIFVSLLTLQTIVGTAADTTGTKVAKFAIGNFIPVVGGALSDAFTTVQGYVKLLKSGVGAFGILAAGCIFLPILLQCLLWMATVHICACVGDIFDLKQISSLLRAGGKVISILLSIILCCMMILTVSTVLVLVIGGGGSAG